MAWVVYKKQKKKGKKGKRKKEKKKEEKRKIEKEKEGNPTFSGTRNKTPVSPDKTRSTDLVRSRLPAVGFPRDSGFVKFTTPPAQRTPGKFLHGGVLANLWPPQNCHSAWRFISRATVRRARNKKRQAKSQFCGEKTG